MIKNDKIHFSIFFFHSIDFKERNTNYINNLYRECHTVQYLRLFNSFVVIFFFNFSFNLVNVVFESNLMIPVLLTNKKLLKSNQCENINSKIQCRWNAHFKRVQRIKSIVYQTFLLGIHLNFDSSFRMNL